MSQRSGGTVATVVSRLHVAPPGDAVTVYDLIGAPPSAGAVHDTRAASLYGTAVGRAGCAGVVSVVPPGVIAADATDGAESPTAFRATTVKVIGTFESPVTTHVVRPRCAQDCPVDAVTT